MLHSPNSSQVEFFYVLLLWLEEGDEEECKIVFCVDGEWKEEDLDEREKQKKKNFESYEGKKTPVDLG